MKWILFAISFSYVSEQNEYVLICCFQSKQTRKSLRSEYKDQTTIE